MSLFSCTRQEQKPVNGFARSMAQNAWNQANMCLLGISTKIFTKPPISPNSENFALRKQFFAKNTYKSWRKLYQNSYSNRKQPMAISNFGLKIWPEAVFWPFLRMRSRKVAIKYMKSWSNFQNFSTCRKSGTEKSNLRTNFTPDVFLSPFLRMRIKSYQNGSKPGENSGYVRIGARRT